MGNSDITQILHNSNIHIEYKNNNQYTFFFFSTLYDSSNQILEQFLIFVKII